MKTDARVKYTKMVLKKALLELMQHKPVNKITVKEICERAELNRATFYAHYSDCFDLLESIEEELFGQFERSMQSYTRSFDIAGLVDGLYRIVQENEAVCRVLLFGRRSTELIHRMIAYAHDLSISAWRKTLKNASADELEMLYLCLSNGLLSVVLDGYDRFDQQSVIRFFLEIRQYSCEKMSCATQKSLAAGHIMSFQIHPKEKQEDGSIDANSGTSKADAAGLSRADGLHGVFVRLQFSLPVLP